MPEENSNAEADALRSQLTEVQKHTRTAADAVLASVPEALRALIPEGEPATQLSWYAKARTTGVFDMPTVPRTDTGRPTVTPKVTDYSSLPPEARMATGYTR